MTLFNDIVLIVLSCDKYKGLWEPFFTLLKKYWSDCPFKTYLISENPDYPSIEGISEKDPSWASRLKNALKKIEEPYIFLMLEDYLLTEKVDTKRVLKLFEVMKKENILHLGLTPFLHPVELPQFKDYLDLIEATEDPFRFNVQAGIWDKEVFMRILKEGETPWQTEAQGTERSYEFKPFVMMKDEFIMKYIQGVEKGEMPNETKDYLKKEGFDFSSFVIQ